MQPIFIGKNGEIFQNLLPLALLKLRKAPPWGVVMF